MLAADGEPVTQGSLVKRGAKTQRANADSVGKTLEIYSEISLREGTGPIHPSHSVPIQSLLRSKKPLRDPGVSTC